MPEENIQELAASLHPLERKVLPFVEQKTSFEQLVSKSKLQEVEVMRALQWLQNKHAVQIYQDLEEVVTLQKFGQKYQQEKLPERKFLDCFYSKPDEVQSLVAITQHAGLDRNEMNIVLGQLRAKQLIVMEKKQEDVFVSLTVLGKKQFKQPLDAEFFLQKKFPVSLKDLSLQEKQLLQLLQKRKDLVELTVVKHVTASILPLGKKLREKAQDTKVIDAITPHVLASGEWKQQTFRRYDTTVKVPSILGGKYQHYRRFLDDVREKFVSLGFCEMSGPLVETDFWDMDALFMPQFHSARDIQDAYYVKGSLRGKIDEKRVKSVQQMHEKGGSGSTGWRYSFDTQRTHRLLLRTQGTACSARMLASPDLSVPGKYFGITRCFRKDVIDATHLVDFNQTEGIVVEEGLTLRHLFGLLRMFAHEIAGAQEVRLVPGYFPFTEPSVELYAKHPQLGWLELGGAGIFRSEVVVPLLGKDVSVIAWGIGIDRLAMFKLGLKDVRSLFSHDLATLRTTKVTF